MARDKHDQIQSHVAIQVEVADTNGNCRFESDEVI